LAGARGGVSAGDGRSCDWISANGERGCDGGSAGDERSCCCGGVSGSGPRGASLAEGACWTCGAEGARGACSATADGGACGDDGTGIAGAAGAVGLGTASASASPSRPTLSLRISVVEERKSASSSNSSSLKALLNPIEPGWCTPGAVDPGRWAGLASAGLLADAPTGVGPAPWNTSSLFRTIALKVPVAAVHSGFGGGSMKTWLTSASALNSSASSGMTSSSSISSDGAGRDGGAGGC
jgi:hypothetical protein